LLVHNQCKFRDRDSWHNGCEPSRTFVVDVSVHRKGSLSLKLTKPGDFLAKRLRRFVPGDTIDHRVTPVRRSSDNPLLVSALISAILALVYCVAKIDMAIKGDVGMPGIPLSDPKRSSDLDDVWLRQLGNATVGLGAALLALATLVTLPSRRARIAIAAALWVGFAFVVAGAGGILLRTAGLLDSLGDVPLTWASGATNAVGISLSLSWLVMAILYTRRIFRPA
jgi:hypothetical protein